MPLYTHVVPSLFFSSFSMKPKGPLQTEAVPSNSDAQHFAANPFLPHGMPYHPYTASLGKSTRTLHTPSPVVGSVLERPGQQRECTLRAWEQLLSTLSDRRLLTPTFQLSGDLITENYPKNQISLLAKSKGRRISFSRGMLGAS